jgi:hypothetical protein
MIKVCGIAGALMLWIAPAAAQSNAALPADIQAAIRKAYVMPDADARIRASASASQAAGSGPSFDCAKASSAVEKAVC